MNIKRLVSCSAGVSLLSLLSVLVPSESANASFACGPHLATYKVRSLNGWPGAGVRCVRFNVQNEPGFIIWYGEGQWGSGTYRHVGVGYLASMGRARASASDIFGNGEDAMGDFRNSLNIVSSGGSIPRTMRVTGDWNEEWILEGDGIVQEYTSRLGPVNTCGQHLVESSVSDASGRRSGSGIRCGTVAFGGAWYGEGNWGGDIYAHLGYGTVDHAAGAFDICEPSKSRSCNAFNWGSLKTNNSIPGQPFPGCRRVSGAWSEIWNQRNSWTNFNGQYIRRPTENSCR